jgi:hypothetical protein
VTRRVNVGAMVRRLLFQYLQAPAEGARWYVGARWTVRRMARTAGVTVATAAGVVAALSPRLHWSRNITAARVVLAGERPSGVFSASLRKAERIYKGARPLSVLSGLKVRAFYRALMGDDRAAVIDTWVLHAVGWAHKVTDRVYAAIARALMLAAKRVHRSVVELQAAVWVAVRGRAA